MKFPLWLALTAVGSASLFAQQASPIEVIHVRGSVYMLASDVGNVTVQVGTRPGLDAVLLVDTSVAAMTPALVAEIQKISPFPLRYIVTTSADPDHNGGTEALTKPSGPQRVTLAPAGSDIGIFAQDNVMIRLSAKDSQLPSAAWPTLTFESMKDFQSNGESVQLIAEPRAHTDGDGIVFFRTSNVISTGDIFRMTGYPVIDIARGGSIQGELKALNHLLQLTVPDHMQEGGTMVIPGHGRLCDEGDLADYRDMVTIIHDRVADLMKKGKSLADIQAARLSHDYDRRYSTPDWTGEMFVEAIYKSLNADRGGK